MWIGVWLSVFGIFHCCFAETQKYRSVRRTTAAGSSLKTQALRSRLECAASCTLDPSCDVCGYNDGTGQCKLFAWEGAVFRNPNNQGQNASTVMIRRKLEIVRVNSWGGQAVAESICQAFGGGITTYTELQYAFYNLGLHIGICARVSSGNLYYALQHLVPGTGYQGINSCYWKSDGDVFCTIPGPTG